MQKIFLFMSLFWFLASQPTDKKARYADIQDDFCSKTGQISLSLKQSGVKEVQERIAIMEQYKIRAWKDGNLALRSRLHEEIIYEKEPWYQKHSWVPPLITFFVTGFTVAAIKVLTEKK